VFRGKSRTPRSDFLSHNVITRPALALCARLRGVVGRVLPRKRRRRHLELTCGHEFTSFVRRSATFLHLRTEKWFSGLRERDLAQRSPRARMKDTPATVTRSRSCPPEETDSHCAAVHSAGPLDNPRPGRSLLRFISAASIALRADRQ